MGFFEGYVVGRAVSARRRPYVKANGTQAATLYPGGAMLGLGVLLAANGNTVVGLPLLAVGCVLMLVGACVGGD